jgi:hypothetical protein
MNDKLKQLLQSPSPPSIRLGWVVGKGMGVGVEEMAEVVVNRCVVDVRRYIYFGLVLGCSVTSLTITNQSTNNNHRITIPYRSQLGEDIWNYNPHTSSKYDFSLIKKAILNLIINYFNHYE